MTPGGVTFIVAYTAGFLVGAGVVLIIWRAVG